MGTEAAKAARGINISSGAKTIATHLGDLHLVFFARALDGCI